MKRPTKMEEAALEAAFSRLQLFREKKNAEKNIWKGWKFIGDELVDDAGNRYGQNEIRAIFYNRKRLEYLDRLEAAARPPSENLPVQLCLPIEPAWKTLCQDRR